MKNVDGDIRFRFLLTLFMPPPRDQPPESPNSWNATLPRSSGSMSANPTVDDSVVTVGDAEVKLRKSKKKKKRSSMIFISEERERTSTMDCKRVRESRKNPERWKEAFKRKYMSCVIVFV